jgi:alkylation response protein AidB-like acyl-CoA dehydrogenase
VGVDLIEAAEGVVELVEAHADKAEQNRRLPKRLVQGLRDAQLFRMCVPEVYGGPEADPVTLVRAIETVAAADGAAGWCTMIASTTSSLSMFLEPDAARLVYGDAKSITGGAYAPNGTATRADGTWTVSGRWQWGSGSQHCAWLTGGVIADDGSQHLVFLDAADVTIHDTWYVAGLRGTGSNDFSVDAVSVPEALSFPSAQRRPHVDAPLSRFPNFTLLAAGVAGVSLGIGRRALDEFAELGSTKKPQFASRTISQMGSAQADLARAEARLRSARAFLLDELAQAWEVAAAGGRVEVASRVRIRLAGANAAEAGAAAATTAYTLAGGVAVFEGSPLQRCLRDSHVATQHIMVAPRLFETLGKHLFGADIDATMI